MTTNKGGPRSFPVFVSQRRTVQSSELEASRAPLGEYATEHIFPTCPTWRLTARQLNASQMHIVVSSDPVAISRPSGEKATEITQSVCPSRQCIACPVMASQILTRLSLEPDTILDPSGENATDQIAPVCPSSRSVASLAPVFQTLMISSFGPIHAMRDCIQHNHLPSPATSLVSNGLSAKQAFALFSN